MTHQVMDVRSVMLSLCVPEDFAFQLTQDERAALTPETETLKASLNLRSQNATSKAGGGIRSQFATASKRNIRYLPVAFTEHGALMAANILHSPRAVAMSVYVIPRKGVPDHDASLIPYPASRLTSGKLRTGNIFGPARIDPSASVGWQGMQRLASERMLARTQGISPGMPRFSIHQSKDGPVVGRKPCWSGPRRGFSAVSASCRRSRLSRAGS